MSEVRHRLLARFVPLMRAELEANQHKGDRWTEVDRDAMSEDLLYHYVKLDLAVRDGHPGWIREYAADVANLCAMLVDAVGELENPPPDSSNYDSVGSAELHAQVASLFEDMRSRTFARDREPVAE